MDWLKLKTEYITTDISYRRLAEKYGIRYATLQRRATDENWPELRDQHRAKVVSKSLRKIEDKKARQAAKVADLADRLLIRLEQATDELDKAMVTHKTKTRQIDYRDGSAPGKPTKETIHEEEQLLAVESMVDRGGLRLLTAALRDLQEITGQITDLERQEREARIASLRKQSQEERSGSITIQLEGGLQDYAK